MHDAHYARREGPHIPAVWVVELTTRRYSATRGPSQRCTSTYLATIISAAQRVIAQSEFISVEMLVGLMAKYPLNAAVCTFISQIVRQVSWGARGRRRSRKEGSPKKDIELDAMGKKETRNKKHTKLKGICKGNASALIWFGLGSGQLLSSFQHDPHTTEWANTRVATTL